MPANGGDPPEYRPEDYERYTIRAKEQNPENRRIREIQTRERELTRLISLRAGFINNTAEWQQHLAYRQEQIRFWLASDGRYHTELQPRHERNWCLIETITEKLLRNEEYGDWDWTQLNRFVRDMHTVIKADEVSIAKAQRYVTEMEEFERDTQVAQDRLDRISADIERAIVELEALRNPSNVRRAAARFSFS